MQSAKIQQGHAKKIDKTNLPLILTKAESMPEISEISEKEWIERIALTFINNIGGVNARNLINHCGSVQEIFDSTKKSLTKIPGIGDKLANTIVQKAYWQDAEREWKFIQQEKIKPLFYLDKNFPIRLKECRDTPVLLYYQGEAELNNKRVLAVVGTRKATNYGKDIIKQITEALAPLNILVVSGLAFGVDITAHKAALDNNLPTVGVLGHSFEKIYPATHKRIANQMKSEGGLLTEFPSQTRTDKENFPRRNRIIAGMSDATLVVETADKGGSMITAYQAHGYSRKVMAIPGKVHEKYSIGCNHLIKTKVADLVENADDIIELMDWEKLENTTIQRSLFVDLSKEEEELVALFENSSILHMDELNQQSKLDYSNTAAIVLGLELKGLLRTIPGNQIQLLR